MLSIIIVWNNLEKYNEACKYIGLQDYKDVEIIGIDNREKIFSSASSALNHGASISKGDMLLFMHQDMYLWQNDALSKIVYYLSKEPNSIMGVAGIDASTKKVISDICEDKEKKIKRLTPLSNEINEVITLDECLFSMKKSLWQRIKFDEENCNSWHLYGVDICYANIIFNGGKNYVISLDCCHDSFGKADNDFYKTLKKLVKKYKNKIDNFCSCCASFKCNMHCFQMYRIKKLFKLTKKRYIKKLKKI